MSTGTETFYRHAGEIAQDLDSAIIASLSAAPPACGREEALELESFATGEALAPVIRMFRTGLKSVHVAGISGDVGRDAVLLSLARSLAETGRRILVVDADGDGPPLAQSGRPGLTDVLTDQVSLTNVILPSPGYEGMMAFLPIGTQPPSLETPGAVEPLVRTLDDIRPSYDVTLVSGPCLDRRGKVHPAATACEAVVLVLSPGIVSRDRIRRNFLQLWGVEAPIRGLITLRVPDVVAEVIPEGEESEGVVVHDTTPEVANTEDPITSEDLEGKDLPGSGTPADAEAPEADADGLELVGVSNGLEPETDPTEADQDRGPVEAREVVSGDPPIISLEPTEPEESGPVEDEICEFEDGIHQEHGPAPVTPEDESVVADPLDNVDVSGPATGETSVGADTERFEIPEELQRRSEELEQKPGEQLEDEADEWPDPKPDLEPDPEPEPEATPDADLESEPSESRPGHDRESQLTFLEGSEADETEAADVDEPAEAEGSGWPEKNGADSPAQPTEDEMIASLVQDSGPPPDAFQSGGVTPPVSDDADDLEAVEQQARAVATDRTPRGGSDPSGFKLNPVTMGVGALVVIGAAVIMFWLLPRLVGGEDDALEGLAGTTELERGTTIPEESVVTKEQLTEATPTGSGPESVEETGASRPTSATIDQSPPPPADPPPTPTTGRDRSPTGAGASRASSAPQTPLEVPDGVSTLRSEKFRGVSPFFSVHITSFRKPEGAAIDAQRLEKVTGYTTDYIDTEVVKDGKSTGEWYRVIVGRFQDPDDAARAARAFREKGITDYARVYYITGP